MKKSKIKFFVETAIGIVLFAVLSLSLQVLTFRNYSICLGYIVMTYCCSRGTVSGTLVGTLGIMLYRVLVGGSTLFVGWAVANLLLGIILGITFGFARKIKKPMIRRVILLTMISAGTAIAMLVIKSGIECWLYALPFITSATLNIPDFVANTLVIITSLPLCKILDKKSKKVI